MKPKRLRSLVLQAAVMALAGVAAVLAAADQLRWSLVIVALLVGLVAVIALDVRARAADLAHMARLAAQRQAAGRDTKAAERELANLAEGVKKLTEGVKTLREKTVSREKLRSIVHSVVFTSAKPGATLARLETAERRMVLAAERTRSEVETVGASLRERLDNSLRSIDSNVARHHRETNRRTRDLIVEAVRNIDATGQLAARIDARAPLPPTGGFAISARNLLLLTALAQEWRPKTVVELGSGTSTVWLGHVAQEVGGRVVSIDHLEQYASLTSEWLRRHGLGSVVEVRHAPLEEVTVDETTQPWYGISRLDGLESIDLLVVDGPPEATAPQARFPALPLLVDRLADEAYIVLDDAARPDEQSAVARWIEMIPGLEKRESLSDTLAVLHYRRPGTATSD